ncbi:reductive dehalogenase [Dehalogenimonas etheniformans]|uniref:Reductive dehalogenase n=1 Tax=Dehalogenimonas etheniformans TaxID=1536648 RepID=A0A2P5P6A0_9CHLR|nr:reductive dehalogenase [Dehalogenimonas etheniformans]PPD57826.1 reductive dehalogenase [Dehalogenimonas etheniformans]QNT76071.1 reductive dehalogenase [Dehalogenimonas etheniformans]
MTNFHTSINRREFMKGLGLAGASAAAISAFGDIDSLTAGADLSGYRKWWQRDRNFEDLTTPIDWSVFKPYDPGKLYFMPSEVYKRQADDRRARQLSGINNKTPGASLRDLALDNATYDNFNMQKLAWDGNTRTATPLDRGASGPWVGTPEENLRTMRAAAHFYGAPKVGAIEVNEHTKRLFDLGTTVWEDIDAGFVDSKAVYHIPNKCKWILTWLIKQNYPQSLYALRNSDSADQWKNKVFELGQAARNASYSNAPQIRWNITGFLHGLGYTALQPPTSANVPFGLFSGLAEQGRTAYSCSPDYGLSIRYVDWAITDLPLEPTPPIDAGVLEFCKVCKRCAVVCPSGALSLENDTTWDVAGEWNRGGFKGWHQNWKKCAEWGGPHDCSNCQLSCPFNHPPEASIHNIVRAAAGCTSVLDGFFANMDRSFGYSSQKTESERKGWWDRNLATWPYDDLKGFGAKDW